MEPTGRSSSGKLKVVLMLSILVNATLISVLILNPQRPEVPSSQYTTLLLQNQNLTMSTNSLKQEVTILQSQLSYYRSQAEYYSRYSRSNNTAGSAEVGRSEINIVAVNQAIGSLGEFAYEGVTMTAHVELREGIGRLLINTRPKIGMDLQTSANTAILIAENLTGRSLRNTDVILTVTAEREIEVVDGPSAGAAITVALVAAMRNQTIAPTVFITGTINPDGTVGKIGGVLEKALAVARFGGKRFIVPIGQTIAVTYRAEESHPAPGLTIITTKPESVNLQEYLKKEGYNIEILEASNITEAYGIVLSSR